MGQVRMVWDGLHSCSIWLLSLALAVTGPSCQSHPILGLSISDPVKPTSFQPPNPGCVPPQVRRLANVQQVTVLQNLQTLCVGTEQGTPDLAITSPANLRFADLANSCKCDA